VGIVSLFMPHALGHLLGLQVRIARFPNHDTLFAECPE
jgi:hypothetical protein